MNKTRWISYLFLLAVVTLVVSTVLYYSSQHLTAITAVPADKLNHSSGAALLLQIIVILSTAKLVGQLLKYCSQPSVIGEILAGIALGPSLFGWLFPELQQALFPPSAAGQLQTLSHIGIVFFLFGVGAELDTKAIAQQKLKVLLISHASLLVPFVSGIAAAFLLYDSYAPRGLAFHTFALFVGVALSISAFPVLVRILRDRNMSAQPLGQTAIMCAAVGDVSAWCLLALVVAMGAATQLQEAFLNMLALLVFAWCLFHLVKPFINTIQLKPSNEKNALAMLIVGCLACALFTEWLGMHMLFGAFLAGVVIADHDGFKHLVLTKLEPFAAFCLLPIFFVLSGLRTEIAALSFHDWWVCGALILLASITKVVGVGAVARLERYSWNESLTLGVLMNTRGLMELVVLNIGYDLGFISAELFTILLIMAIVTTLMTGPLLDLLRRQAPSSSDGVQVSKV